MSLSPRQIKNTRRELQANLERSGLNTVEVARGIGTSEEYVLELMDLRPKRLEDTWILRNFLIDAVIKTGQTPVEFTALKGDWHDYWFLNGSYIDGKRITE